MPFDKYNRNKKYSQFYGATPFLHHILQLREINEPFSVYDKVHNTLNHAG